ncbi:MAG: Rpp14/Pop5 family protein [Nanoarchaeota archaeon]|nr:Rpp14/Pop5 family protein [Nanoarchaeota archaeon]
MPLLPTLKPKKRYIVFEILAEKEFSFPEVKTAIEEALLRFLGEWGTAKASPLFVKEKYKNNKFILKVSHLAVDEVKAAIILIKSIKNVPVIIRSITVSGTIKKASSTR